jgi:hypothetical protein
MAFVVARKGGRFEIRESRSTPAGPRARTLVTFRVLDDDVLDRAAALAETAFDRTVVQARAQRLGAPLAIGTEVERDARALIASLVSGHRAAPVLRAMLTDALGPAAAIPKAVRDSVHDVMPWVGISADARGEALRDLLLLTDRLPAGRRAELEFPGFMQRSAL